ncbi:MAG: hypothetical protein PHI02_07390 [Sulfurovaceae bacterium]|nr:hypothetical protein [Sulfurovaceae bacterium]
MKKRYALILAMVLMFGGCDKKDANSEENIATNEVKDMKESMQEAAKEISKYTSEDLKKATPLSNDKLKELLPKSVDGIERKSFHIGQMGFHAAEAEYKADSKKISLSILDGAGEAGAAMIGMTKMGISAGGESENENGYMKPFSLGDSQGVEEQEKSSDGSNVTNKVTLVVGDRFLVTFEAQGIEMDKLKSIVEDSNIIDDLEDAK